MDFIQVECLSLLLLPLLNMDFFNNWVSDLKNFPPKQTGGILILLLNHVVMGVPSADQSAATWKHTLTGPLQSL